MNEWEDQEKNHVNEKQWIFDILIALEMQGKKYEKKLQWENWFAHPKNSQKRDQEWKCKSYSIYKIDHQNRQVSDVNHVTSFDHSQWENSKRDRRARSSSNEYSRVNKELKHQLWLYADFRKWVSDMWKIWLVNI